ncbi:MAG: PEP-CTERM sorting domain-containing protein, partial [Akkermansia sp.]
SAAVSSLSDATVHGDSDLTGISGVSGSFSYTITLNANAMKNVLGKNSGSAVRPMLVWVDNNYEMGLAMALNNTGFVGTYNFNESLSDLTMGGGTGENRQPMTGEGSNPATNNFADSSAGSNLTSKLDSLTGLAVTFSHSDTVSSSLYVTLRFSDGSITELYGTSTTFKWSSGVGSTSEVKINEDYIDHIYLFNEALSKKTAQVLNKEASVPEPTTATLSLLALVGLCARRRRRK